MAGPRVCMAAWTLPPGKNVTGTPAHVVKTREALRRAGLEVSLLELDLYRAQEPRVLANLVRTAEASLRSQRPDVVHAHGHAAACALLPLTRSLGIPLVCEVHGVYVTSPRGLRGGRYLLSRAAAFLELPVLRAVDHVIAQALAMKRRLAAGGVAEHRITVLYPGLQTREFSEYSGPPAPIPGVADGDIVVLYAGSTHAYQGLPLLARAQARLPREYRIVLALSSDGDVGADPVAAFGFDAQRTVVMQLERSADLPALFRRADVLVHARPDIPDNANVQSKLGLYLAAGRPIAVTDVGDYRTLLAGEPGCVLARPEPEDLARAIIEAASRPGIAAAARTGNVLLARRHFDADANAAVLERLYAQLARVHASGAPHDERERASPRRRRPP